MNYEIDRLEAGPNTSAKGIYLARVISNAPICREHFRLTIEVDDFPLARPGQFLHILCRDPEDIHWLGGAFIRRPFSLGGLRRNGGRAEIDIIHRVIGPGTRWLSHLQPGDTVNVLGPQGKPFTIDSGRPIAYLVGGGVGLPPILWLAEAVRDTGLRGIAFCGARTADLLPLTLRPGVTIEPGEPAAAFEDFSRFDTPAVVCTDDGSLGTRGLIPDAFESYLQRHRDQADQATVYTCGPEPMMRAVAAVCEKYNLPCQVCMERMMACGMGTCQSCVVPIRDAVDPQGWRYRLCCTDGPVFDSRQILWEEVCS
ncbi:MAG TPA: dihydroorotate dehydrogenase electron transfer subunit [Phycisphaerae bacterium]|nr:dihydroorotate dehydrogenase electron transfer subunit [Phycisphaerae bacterium]